MLSIYEKAIVEATGCAPEEAAQIEDIMRHEIFHSTLDWQSREELDEGARQAARLLPELKAFLSARGKESDESRALPPASTPEPDRIAVVWSRVESSLRAIFAGVEDPVLLRFFAEKADATAILRDAAQKELEEPGPGPRKTPSLEDLAERLGVGRQRGPERSDRRSR